MDPDEILLETEEAIWDRMHFASRDSDGNVVECGDASKSFGDLV